MKPQPIAFKKGSVCLPNLMDGCRLVSELFGGFEDDERRDGSQFMGFEQAVDGSLNGAV